MSICQTCCKAYEPLNQILCPHCFPPKIPSTYFLPCSKCSCTPCICTKPPNPPDPTPPPPMPMGQAKALFEEAHRLIGGDRKTSYGDYGEEAPRVAQMWSAILNHPVEARQVPLMMMALKLERMAAKEHRDSLTDLVGYAGLLAEMEAPK